MPRSEEPRPWLEIVTESLFRIRPWPRPDPDRAPRTVQEALDGTTRFRADRRDREE